MNVWRIEMIKKLLKMNEIEELGEFFPEYHIGNLGEYLFINTGSSVLLQAHFDTVATVNVDLIENNGIYRNKHGVLGADDRAGIYAILKLLPYNPSILITDGEESGGWGMRCFTEDIDKSELKNVNICLALDRQGVGEYVVYNDIPEKVHNYVKSFGFHREHGTFSDCSIFTDNYGIPSVNLSVGYHKQHTANEYLVMDELELTINRVKKMLLNPITKRHNVKKKKYDWYDLKPYWSKRIYYENNYGFCEICRSYGDLEKVDDYNVCEYCKKLI